MSDLKNDPIGKAILDYASTGIDADIIVESDICDDDVIPVSYLFRTSTEMPQIEKLALEKCSGKILDAGAAAGVHSKVLINSGKSVEAIDISPLSVKYLKEQKIPARVADFNEFKDEKYDTILLLMNGIGIAGELSNLKKFLLHCKSLLTENGKIICDSTDIKYLYEDDEGGMWVDLASEYYGDFRFRMHYKDQSTDWFNWLYVDQNELSKAADAVGLNMDVLFEENDHYLAVLNKK